MKGAIGRKINNPNSFRIPNVSKQTAFSLQSSSSFCSASGRGRGGGRGGPSGSSPFDGFAPTKSPGQPANESKPESSPQPSGHGHGHGRPPVPPSGSIPSFSSFISLVKSGAGRGRVSSESDPSKPTELPRTDPLTPQPRTFTPSESSTDSTESNLPSSIVSALSGAGRGKPGVKKPPLPPAQAPEIKEESGHIEARAPHGEAAPAEARRTQPKQSRESVPSKPKLSREEAVKNAMRVLSQSGEGEGISSDGLGRGRGRGKGRGRGRGRGRGEDRMRRIEMEDMDEGFGAGLYLGDNADGEKMAEKVGVENMNTLGEAFEEMSDRVVPSVVEDAYVDAMHTNFMIECEPEYLMEEFGTNPDIDEKPPISLRDALEKMKPFLMAYEGIQSQEEWEEAVNEVMERVPLLKEIVDHYSGPDRVTAKQQQEELERVAKRIPKKAPASLKRFANRAVLSLQSNPGWGFDKKCQFMDKLVWEISQQYK